MKNLLILLFLFFFVDVAFAQDTLRTKDTVQVIPESPQISFTTKEHNFGTIKQGTVVSYDFEFTNTGKKPLRLLAVQVGCDCTTPLWEKKNLAYGEKATIKVVYSPKSKHIGEQKATIFVISNAQNKEELLYLKGLVTQN